MKNSHRQAEWIVAHSGYFQIGGILQGLAFFGLQLPFIFTALACYWLGLIGHGFSSWRREPGLWMLGVLFLIPTVFAYAWLTYTNLLPIIGAAQPFSVFLVDFSLTTIVFSYSLRFLITTISHNYQLTKIVG